MLEKLGSHNEVVAYWNKAAPHVQARFCKETLGTKFKIDRVGDLDYLDTRINKDFRVMHNTAAGERAKQLMYQKEPVDLVAFMAGDGDGVGEAVMSVACGVAWWKMSLTQIHSKSPAKFARVSSITPGW